MNVAAILSRQDRRHVSNDYTIRLNNVFYQLLPPPVPGLRGGYVTVEKRLDGSLHIRLKGQYLKYKICGPTQALGALPPAPPEFSPREDPSRERGRADYCGRRRPRRVDGEALCCASCSRSLGSHSCGALSSRRHAEYSM